MLNIFQLIKLRTEESVNEWWRPGGRTYPGDIPEGVMPNIDMKKEDFTFKDVLKGASHGT